MTYNGAKTIERALKSLLAQTHRNYELIISDDHSADDTLAICHRITAGEPRVRFIYPERNLGAEPNMRFALSQATGKYFVWACQDDYWEPECFERLVEALESSPKTVCAQGWVRWFSEDGTRSTDLRLYGRDLPERQSRLQLAVSFLNRLGREDHLKVKNNVFMHGVWNRAVFTAAVNAHGKAFSSERQILCQAALAGEFRYVDKLLFRKQFYNIELHERQAPTDATMMAKAQSTRWLEVQDTLAAIVRSPIVALRMKLVAVPALTFGFLRHRWKMKNRVTRKLANMLRRILPASRQNV